MLETTVQTPAFHVDAIPVYGDLILSPMDGYSDQPFRALCRSLGSAMSYTEFLNAIDITFRHPHLANKMRFLESERPVVYQIFDADVDRLVAAAVKIRRQNPDIIDVNMGCSNNSVSGRGAGAGLLREPHKIARIFAELTRRLDIPVTGKIRLGWDDDTRNYVEVAKIIEDNGGKLIAVHGRTKAMGYGGAADWDAIAEVKRAVRVPVIANGDVKTVADIERIKAHTGADGVMIARAAIGNPWIFSRLDRHEVPREVVRQTMLAHLEENMRFYGDEKGLVFFRKYAARILQSCGIPGYKRQELLTTTEKEKFVALLDELL